MLLSNHRNANFKRITLNMSRKLHFNKKVQVLDDKINSCIEDISRIFGNIENLHKTEDVLNSDELVTDEFCTVLQKVVSVISQSSGIIEFILPHIEEIRKQNIIQLLVNPYLEVVDWSKMDFSCQPTVTKAELQWKSLCYFIEKHSVSTMEQHYMPQRTSYNHFNLCLLKNYISNLHDIFVSDLVWEKYRSFRRNYFDHYICDCSLAGSCFSCSLKLAIQCIYEDELLIYIGCFHPQIITQSAVLDTYIKVVERHLYDLLNLIEECVSRKIDLPEEIISLLNTTKFSSSKNSRSCLICFVQNNINTEIATIIYCIKNNFGTVSLWNKVFIHSIIKIIEALSSFEDQINAFSPTSKDSKIHFHAEDFSTLLEGSRLVLATDSPEQSPFHGTVHENFLKRSSQVETLKVSIPWNWRLSIVEHSYLTKLQRSLQNDVEEVVKKWIEKEKQILQTNQWQELLDSEKNGCFFSHSMHTRSLIRSVENTIQILEKYLPVLSASCDAFLPFKSSFSHTLETYVIDLIKHLQHISKVADRHFLIYFEYIAANNALFLRDRLQCYWEILKDSSDSENENSKNNVYQSACELSDELVNSIFLHHYKYLICGILFDADSYNFEDKKAFFEGERIAYSIQMWNMYMRGLFHDLAYFLPQNVAQELYARILSTSLDHFLIRYSHCSPSEFRSSQIAKDVFTLLLCVSELLYPACSSVSHITGAKNEMDQSNIASYVNGIHSTCCCLLTVLVIQSAPLQDLHKVFKDGFPVPRLSLRMKSEAVAPWLPWIRRELFTDFGQSHMMSNVAVWLAVRACTTWVLPNPCEIIKAFTEHHCTLSILLMMQATYCNDQLNEKNEDQHCTEDSKIRFAYAVFQLMSCYNDKSCLHNILLPVIEKTNGWEEFDISTANKELAERSWWYAGLHRILRSYFESIFEELMPLWSKIKRICEASSELESWAVLKNDLKEYVICICDKDPLNSFRDDFEISDEIISYVCLKKMLESMHRNLVSLPQALKFFLISIDIHIENYVPEIQPIWQSVPLQVLLSSAVLYLNDDGFAAITNNVRDMACTTRCALNSFLSKKDLFSANGHYMNIIQMLLSSMQADFNSLKNNFGKIVKDKNFDDIQNEILELTTSKLIQMPSGESILLYLHQVLCQNKQWIQSSLGIPEMLSQDVVVSSISPSPLPNFSSEISDHTMEHEPFSFVKGAVTECGEPVSYENCRAESFESECSSKQTIETAVNVRPQSYFNPNLCIVKNGLNLDVEDKITEMDYNFNPLTCFDVLGASSFVEIARTDPIIPWEALLTHTPILGLTEVNFCMLLSQRWDMKSDAILSPEEAKYIEELRSTYKQI